MTFPLIQNPHGGNHWPRGSNTKKKRLCRGVTRGSSHVCESAWNVYSCVKVCKVPVLSHQNVMKLLGWSPSFDISLLRNIRVFVVFIHSRWRSIQKTLNIKGARLQKRSNWLHKSDISSGVSLSCSAPQLLKTGRRERKLWLMAGICSGSVCFLSFDWWDWFLCCAAGLMVPFSNRIIVWKFNLT